MKFPILYNHDLLICLIVPVVFLCRIRTRGRCRYPGTRGIISTSVMYSVPSNSNIPKIKCSDTVDSIRHSRQHTSL